MQAVARLAFRALEIVMVLLLAGMVVMVFGNVVLRYGFNPASWFRGTVPVLLYLLTFIGAVVTFRDNAHLGVESLVARFGRGGRLVCLILTDIVIILCCAVFFWGTWMQSGINASNVAPVTGISMIWIFGVGFFTSIGIGLLALIRLVKAVTGRITEEEISLFAGEGEVAAAIRERAE
jgi:TRAP-type C4-dicarboxylate transport system permease small subunit